MFSAEFSTNSKIFATVESEYSFVTFTFKRPFILIHPFITLSPADTSIGIDSPVSAVVFRLEEPSVIIPSRGTFSPGFIIIISPTDASSGSICSTFPSLSTLTYSGHISISADMEFLLFPTAIDSKRSPT